MLVAAWLCALQLKAQVLTWDAAPGTAGLQNGNGTWNTTVANWLDSTNANVLWGNTGLETAQFGSTSPVNPSLVTLASSMNLKGINFLALASTTPVSGQQYSLNGAAAGTVLNFGEGGLIQMADFSSGGSQFISLGANLALQGNNLTLQKSAGTVTQFINLNMASNPNLTGELTIGSYIYAGITALGTVANVSGITVKANGTLTLASGGNYTMPLTIAGYTQTYGAIRVTGSNVTLSGGINLTNHAGILMHTANTGLLINAPITDGGMNYGLHRFTLTKSDGTVTLTAANTYGGDTTLGRATGGYTGSITALDFAATGAPAQDILYNGLATPGNLNLIGSNIGSSVLTLNGKAGAVSSQRLGNINVQGMRSAIEMTSGAGGEMNLSFGNIVRTGTGMLSLVAPASGTLSTTMADGFVGPWATYKSGTGEAAWAQVSGGRITGFHGTMSHVTGSGYASDVNAHLNIGSGSSGAVSQSGPLAYLGTVSMTDEAVDRSLPIGNGNTLRLGPVGGIQITSDARSLTVGEAGGSSILSAGGSSAGAGQLILTNHSATSLLTVHSSITNNAGGGAVTLLINGAASSNTVLTGTSSYTGGTIVASGALEIRNPGALGTSGTVNVLEGGTLRLAGGLSLARGVTLSGIGTSAAGEGALRSVSGNNGMSGLVTLVGNAAIMADAGSTLTLQQAAATNSVAGTYNLNMGGRGDVVVNGRLAIGTGILTKVGNGILTLAGDNNFTGALTINTGVVRATHANALGVSGSTFGSTSVASGAALEVAGGVTLAAEPITISGIGVGGNGAIRNVSGNNTLTGLITLGGVTTLRMQSDVGKLTFDTASGASVLHSATTARVLILGGAGDMDFVDPLSRTSTGAFTLQKEGNGTVTLATSSSNTVTTLNGGRLHLDFSAATSPVSNILHSGIATPNEMNFNSGTLQITGKPGANNSQAFGPVVVSGVNVTNGGSSYLNVAQNGAARVDLSFGAITRGLAGILGVSRASTGNLSTSGGTDNSIFLSTLGTPYLWSLDAANGDEWMGSTAATSGVRQIVPLSSLTTGGYTASAANALAGNANIAAGVGTTTLGANTSITSLRFAQAQDTLVTQDVSGRVLTVGGILVSSTVGNFTQTLSTSTLKAPESGANNDLPIIQNNTAAPLVINSAIVNITGFSTGVTKGGLGTLVLKGACTYSGSTRVHEGVLHFQGGSISSNTEFLLGSGERSGKIILGTGSTAFNTTVDWLQVMGTGTDNRIVGGASVISTLMVDNPTTNNNFRAGFLGGSGANENNLSLSVNDVSTLSTAASPTPMFLPLGPANTYAGQTLIRNATVEASVLANKGQASSLGTGAVNEVIEMASGGNSTVLHVMGALRYVGSSDAVTDRPVQIANSVSTVQSVTAVLENNGTGTVQFTAPITSTGTNLTAARTLRLAGSNAGANQIFSLGDNGSVGTRLQKTGAGTWMLAADSTYSGGTQVDAGALLVINGSGAGSGSATGSGGITVAAGALLGGHGRILAGPNQNITLTGGTLQIGSELPGTPATAAGLLTVQTSGSGGLILDAGAILSFDLFSGAGFGDNSSLLAAADLAVIQGTLSWGSSTILQVSNPLNMTAWAANDKWRLFDWSGLSAPVAGNISSFDLPSLPDGLMWNTSDLFSTGILSISLVPEPGRAAFTIFGLFSLCSRRRRR